ncbi:ethanolaminephosphotransferase 1 isoform X2 [Condylostylus longicornis]|uniref:ethanolaminephosphotransferase 1 isoform X2 n=1 Tax=Condylostylus longicornis TaxID=2530218 RepID=UPI00244DE997|nr:ethanolaminephosphotransferase 1 isoform X2 [Condylostylus longicornis]
MFGIKYLTEAHLKGFEKYKYSCIDTSYLSRYIMHPFWNWCVQFFPTWMAPNLITFSGFLLNVLTFLMIAYFDWNFTAANNLEKNPYPIPRWVWLVAAISVFVAYTLDGIDGKQARKTGTSGPLGELFDHGLDSYSTIVIALYMFSLFGTIDLPPIRMYMITYLIYQNFYLSHFEKYNTGVMFLPWGFDFTLWAVTLTLLLTYFVGPWIWRCQLPYGLTTANGFEIVMWSTSLLSNHPIVALNIYKSYVNKTGKMRSFFEAARPLFPLLWLCIITLIWIFGSRNSIIDLEPRMFLLMMGTIFSNICCRLIVAQMSDTRTDGFNIFLWPLCAVVIICCFPFYQYFGTELTADTERWILHGLTLFVTIAHIHYGQGIVCEMCDHFNIKCFKIKNPDSNDVEAA